MVWLHRRFGVPAFGVWRLAFGVWRLAFGVWRLAFGVWRLAFGVWRLAFGVWRLAFGVWRFDAPKFRSSEVPKFRRTAGLPDRRGSRAHASPSMASMPSHNKYSFHRLSRIAYARLHSNRLSETPWISPPRPAAAN
ncbi:hypothetical protein D286_30130 [Burkholderia pseudomallei]|nr:hypothetical protein D286_30130 [Burkholderia pseudomallei]